MPKADNLPPSCAVVTKFGNLNFLESSGPVQACNGTDLPIYIYIYMCVCVCVFIYLWLNGHSGPIPSHCRVFEIILRQNHPQHDPSGRAIICRTDLYLTTHSTHERQNILAPARFAPAVTTKRTTPDERLGLRGILQTYNAT